MRWMMSSPTLTTMRRPVPPRKLATKNGIWSHSATIVGMIAMIARNPAPT